MPPRLHIPGLPYLVGSTNKLLRDHIRRQAVAAYEVDRAVFKAITSDKQLPFEIRQQVQRMFETAVPRDSSMVRVRNRCMLTGRPRAVYREFRLSRHMFRELALAGRLPGIVKYSW